MPRYDAFIFLVLLDQESIAKYKQFIVTSNT